MIVQTTRISRAGGIHYLARHLLDKTTENERIEVLAGDRNSLHDSQALASVKGCRYAIRHLSISPEREMTPAQLSQFLKSIDDEFRIGAERPRLIVRHVKSGRSHFHVAVAEVDPVTLRVLDCKNDFRRLEDLARRYEQNHAETVQPTREERRVKRIEGFSDVARKRAERTVPGFDRTRLRQAADQGLPAFVLELDRQGLRMADGEKGPIFVSVAGTFVASANRASGMKRSEFLNFMMGGIENERLIGSQTRLSDYPRDGGEQHSAAPAASIAPRSAGSTRQDRAAAGVVGANPGRPASASERIERPRHTGRSASASIACSREALFLYRLAKLDLDDLLRRAMDFAASIRSLFESERDRLSRVIAETRQMRKSFPHSDPTEAQTPPYNFTKRMGP